MLDRSKQRSTRYDETFSATDLLAYVPDVSRWYLAADGAYICGGCVRQNIGLVLAAMAAEELIREDAQWKVIGLVADCDVPVEEICAHCGRDASCPDRPE